MDRSANPRFEPSVLEWVRRRAGWSIEVLASKLEAIWSEVTPDVIRRWESGLEQPKPVHVKKLAEFYKRPLAVFLLAAPPEEKAPPPDQRTIGSKSSRVFSPATILAIRRARNVQLLANELDEELSLRRPFKYQQFRLTDNPDALAATLRSDLSVSLADQFRVRTYAEFFEYLRERLEASGVLTLRSGGHNSFPIQEARALSFADSQPYVILINNHDTEGAKNFSLLHEFGHILVRQAGICNNFSSFTAKHTSVDTLEVFCNRFAASFLVPSEPFLEHRALRGKPQLASSSELERTVKLMAADFKVGRFVILRKLLTLGLVDVANYNAKAAEWEAEQPPKKKGGRSIPPKTALLNNGPAFSSLVFDAYKHDKLSYAAASDYLGMKAKHLPAFERLMETHGT